MLGGGAPDAARLQRVVLLFGLVLLHQASLGLSADAPPPPSSEQ